MRTKKLKSMKFYYNSKTNKSNGKTKTHHFAADDCPAMRYCPVDCSNCRNPFHRHNINATLLSYTHTHTHDLNIVRSMGRYLLI